jgi:hypothetical protein
MTSRGDLGRAAAGDDETLKEALMSRSRTLDRSLSLVVASILVGAPTLAHATARSIDPSMSQDAVNAVVASLVPDDVLTVAPGTYDGIELDLKTASGAGIAGTDGHPITIQGRAMETGDRPQLIAHTDGFQEAMRIRMGAAYLVIQGLHLSAKGGMTQAGILFDSGVDHIQILDNEIESVTGTGIQIDSQNDVHDVLIEDNLIHDTGTNQSDGANGGYGFSAGGFDTSKAVTGVYALTVRHNLIHDTTGQEGDCAIFLYGVYGSTFEDNVTYSCPRGTSSQSETYGLVSYGTGPSHYQTAGDDNAIRRNLVIGTSEPGQSNVAIYVGPGTIVENNVILDANQGIAARLEDEVSMMRNLSVLHNTVYGVTDYAFSIRGTQMADASVVVANNAFIATDPNAFGYRMPDDPGAMAAAANYYLGQDYAEAAPPVMIKLTAAPSAIFVSPGMMVPGADLALAPGSPLIDVGSSLAMTTNDFDLSPRPIGNGPDVGAYESHPNAMDHWGLALGLKGSAATGIPTDPGSGSTGGSGSGSAGGAGSSGAADQSGAASPDGSSGGCGCEFPSSGSRTRIAAPLSLVLALLVRRARRRSEAARIS